MPPCDSSSNTCFSSASVSTSRCGALRPARRSDKISSTVRPHGGVVFSCCPLFLYHPLPLCRDFFGEFGRFGRSLGSSPLAPGVLFPSPLLPSLPEAAAMMAVPHPLTVPSSPSRAGKLERAPVTGIARAGGIAALQQEIQVVAIEGIGRATRTRIRRRLACL